MSSNGFYLDTKLGRNFGGSSSTTTIKWLTELKLEKHRRKLNLKVNLAALRQIMTLDLPISKVSIALMDFIETGKLPSNLELPPDSDVKVHESVSPKAIRNLPKVDLLRVTNTAFDSIDSSSDESSGRVFRRSTIGISSLSMPVITTRESSYSADSFDTANPLVDSVAQYFEEPYRISPSKSSNFKTLMDNLLNLSY